MEKATKGKCDQTKATRRQSQGRHTFESVPIGLEAVIDIVLELIQVDTIRRDAEDSQNIQTIDEEPLASFSQDGREDSVLTLGEDFEVNSEYFGINLNDVTSSSLLRFLKMKKGKMRINEETKSRG